METQTLKAIRIATWVRTAPAVPLGVIATLALQWLFSQTAWMNAFFGTRPLDGSLLLVCALPMLFMIPVCRLAEGLPNATTTDLSHPSSRPA